MIRSILVSASLEGLEPGWRPPRPPVPVVWFDALRRVRAGRLHALAADLAGRAAFPASAPAGAVSSSTTAAGDGWGVVLFCQASRPASGTVA